MSVRYQNNGFKGTGYFIQCVTDSFEIVLVGEDFEIEELY